MPTPFRRAVRRSPKADPQQYELYRMESEAIGAMGTMRMQPSEIRKFLRRLCTNCKVAQVKVEFTNMPGTAAEWSPPNIIRFSTAKGTARDMITVTHEFAHHLHDQLIPGSSHQNHGPQFVACHMAVLDSVRYIPMYAMKVICERYGIAYMDFGPDGQDLAALQKALWR